MYSHCINDYFYLFVTINYLFILNIQDKTFGLKNKKGAKQQKFIQQVEKQVKSGGVHPLTTADLAAKKAEKDRKLKEERELGLTPKPVATQKVDKGSYCRYTYIRRSTILLHFKFDGIRLK